MRNPESVGYKARNSLWQAYRQRFVNSFNTASAAHTIRPQFMDAYHVSFRDVPVFIGEYHSPKAEELEKDLETILNIADDKSSLFTGLSFFEFQVHYSKGGSASRYGIFDLGDQDVGISNRQLAARCLAPRVVQLQSTRPTQGEKPLGPHCGWLEQDVEYEVEAWWTVAIENITSAEVCCRRCGEDSRCQSWTWLRAFRQCWMRDGRPEGENRKSRPGFISGLPPPRSQGPDGGSTRDGAGEESTALVFASITTAFGGQGVSHSQLCPSSGHV